MSVIEMILSKKEETKYAQSWSLPNYRYKKTKMLIIKTKITIIGDINNNDNSENNYES